MIRWKTMTGQQGTTARVEVAVKARVGSFVMHTRHGKVTLVGQPTPNQLEIETMIDTSSWPVPGGVITSRVIVDAVECSHPTACARTRDPIVYLYMGSVEECIWAELQAEVQVWNAYEGMVCRSCGDIAVVPAKGKGKAKNKGGRPKGAKDSKARKPRSASKVAWEYNGSKGPKGRQVAMIGAAIEHDGIGLAVLVSQTSATHLDLQAGPEGNEYAVTIESVQCRAVDNLEVVQQSVTSGAGAGSSGAGGSGAEEPPKKRRKSGGRKRKELTEEDVGRGLTSLSTQADVERIQKRRRHEEAAAARGKPLKPLRARKNRTWSAEIKEQAVAIYRSKVSAVGEGYEACAKHLLVLPGYKGLTPALLRSWVLVLGARAQQEPNEFGLIVTQAGRPPSTPPELYEELKSMVKGLAQTRAVRVSTTLMQPVVRSLIVHRLGAEVFRPGKGGFLAGSVFLKRLAHDAGLRWRKPYGDARKPPPDAAAQIDDMRLRLAYWMKEHSIPRAMVLNFDHTGLHLMQQRGSTFTEVTEDKDAVHKSRAGKQKEVKLKGATRPHMSH